MKIETPSASSPDGSSALASIREAENEAQKQIREAKRDLEQMLEAAREQAKKMKSQAQEGGELAGSEAFEQTMQETILDAEAVVDRARRAAKSLTNTGKERLPDLVDFGVEFVINGGDSRES
jgi:vacuolar-type H+-ATPase subunit H